MKVSHVRCLVALLWLSACAGVELQGEFTTGRQALLRGETATALAYFERVAGSNPAFITDSVAPRRSIWTYVARGHYESGKYVEARSAAERALSQLGDDYVARLYLGLTLLRPQTPQVQANAFKLEEITFALREGVAPKRVAGLARERGVVFDLTKDAEAQLRKAGADNFLLGELKSIRAGGAKQSKTSGTQMDRAGKELAAALNGLREWLDYTIANTQQGKFWDPNREIRNQIDQGLKQLNQPSTEREELISSTEWIANQIEEEYDRARRDAAAELNRLLRP